MAGGAEEGVPPLLPPGARAGHATLPGKSWASHQLRYSALQHLARLGSYIRLGEQTSARVTADADPQKTQESLTKPE